MANGAGGFPQQWSIGASTTAHTHVLVCKQMGAMQE